MKKLSQKHFIEDDIILVHKPIGITSFGLVARMRGILGTRKVGHAGTLDPRAHGLMIIGFNKGTKKMKHYVGLDKVYVTEIILGISTTTGDSEGMVVERKIPQNNDINESTINIALQSLLGERHYPAPLYSAVKVKGKPLYKYARDGIEPPFVPEKKMDLKKAQVLDIDTSGDVYIIKIRAEVGSGTYIRTLAEEFGKKLGYPASLKSLHRVSIGPYLDKNAFHIASRKKVKKYDIMKVYSIIRNLFRMNKE